MRLTKNSSVCSKLFLRDLEIDRKIGLIIRRSKKYRLTNVDNLKKRFKVNKTELETKYYDV